MKPQTYQLPEETIDALSKFSKKKKKPKQVIVNEAILNEIKKDAK